MLFMAAALCNSTPMPNPPAETINMEYARRVVRFIHDTRFENLPEEVVIQARRCFLDLLSSSFAGVPSRTGQIARNFAASLGGTPECSLIGDDRRVPLPLAVFANATVCEALDCDDGYNPIKGHPGAFLLPVVLAFAEREGLTGREILTSLVVGYEVAMRSGLLGPRLYASYHGSGSWGGVGSAAIAARLMGLGQQATLHALGAAEYHGTMAPIMRCVSYPGMTKDGIGWGAFAGVSAALLARDGFTAQPPNLALVEAGPEIASLGRGFLILDLYFKPYCICRWAQAPVRAALMVACQHKLSPDAIERIVVESFAEACALTHKVPESSEDAQYSVAYPVAAALLYGDVGPEQVLEDCYRDPRAAALCRRTEFVHRPDYQAEFPRRRFAEVKITAGGRTYSSGTVSPHGDPSDPLSSAEIEEKFRRYVLPYLRASETDELLAWVSRLETLTGQDIQRIIATLAGARRNTKIS
jgi:2-methylcitrate dehydratase PrpD